MITAGRVTLAYGQARSGAPDDGDVHLREEVLIGQIALQGPSERLRDDDHVRRAYLGG